MRSLSVIDDPTYTEKSDYTSLESFALRYIRDPRDLPFIHLGLKITLTSLPLAILLFTPLLSGWIWWVVAVGYMVFNSMMYWGPFTLMLHNTSHRKLFKEGHEFFNYYIPWVIGPLFGQSPETYFSHHIGMHHPENNLAEDKSCTMFYQRDSVKGFAIYFLRFLFAGVIELTQYFMVKKRPRFIKMFLRGEFTYIIACILLSVVNWQATLMVFVLPFIFIRFAMMAGNWGQHAFVAADDPSNCYLNSLTCINSKYNKECFNDGYHIGHHLRPAMHWTDMPGDFEKNKEEYARQKAIVLEGVDFFQVWFLLMLKKYDTLADRFVDIGGQYQSKEEVVALLKERTARIPRM